MSYLCKASWKWIYSCFAPGISLLASLHGQGIEDLPVAPQIGPSCGFFANVPAVTWVTGYDINTSPNLTRALYGLRRGDFSYQKSYDKRMLYELFSVPYKVTEIAHVSKDTDALMNVCRGIITDEFDRGLGNGKIYSLRVNGSFGGPHNALLLGKIDSRYLLHDPFGGRRKFLTKDQLAKAILVKSTKNKKALQPSYVTHFLTVLVPEAPVGTAHPVEKVVADLQLDLTDEQRESIASNLMSKHPQEFNSVNDCVSGLPHVDFAVLDDGDKGFRSVIDHQLHPNQLMGALYLSRLMLHVWKTGTYAKLPVLLVDHRPWVVVGCKSADDGAPNELMWMLDDGQAVKSFTTQEVLSGFKKSGALYGALHVAHEQE